MNQFANISLEEREALFTSFMARYEAFKQQKLSLDMSRGKPCSEQLDLSNELFFPLTQEAYFDGNTDLRNYGGLDGLPDMKRWFAELLQVATNEVIVGGNSSLNMMYDTISRAMLFGVCGSDRPWGKLPRIAFICPSPGYDRHFAICETLGIEMIPVDINQDGPDMDRVEELVRQDDAIKGIWCVPKYSNPEGITYSDEVVHRLATMTTKANDFRIFWDNAYIIHHLTDTPDQLQDILSACKSSGNPDRVFMYCSTSKITFPGAGVAAMAASLTNINHMKKQMAAQTIGPDKINQLRHLQFLQNTEKTMQLMQQHAAILRPKFEKTLTIFDAELGGLDIATWSKPNGGYFISLHTLDGCADRVVALAAEAGVILTKAGATFPYGKDPRDRNIRIAPSFPTIQELELAITIVCLCIKIATIENLNNMNAKTARQ
ncbi:aminotransferase class I/II-fold pyridoxal phosphate-dependent enzyme [Paenibacillus sp.]|uniref:aminotransferase class I/II-fold pyridoxal phosphate-dependent enzyme n=1 Tax=Paenibacillus sp. TaxID=58172 RepID=UPI00346438C6